MYVREWVCFNKWVILSFNLNFLGLKRKFINKTAWLNTTRELNTHSLNSFSLSCHKQFVLRAKSLVLLEETIWWWSTFTNEPRVSSGSTRIYRVSNFVKLGGKDCKTKVIRFYSANYSAFLEFLAIEMVFL